ncbi:chromosome partitioning protein ParB [Paracoccus sp. (in: a-proteobacteria)]|uniref:chromosome partitioning protein ParB n=1 Tax=Paracoccus sp. TaxID=267 RepID=UPI0026DF4C74|nr:chromosome partitioning protein ParB [Paracoccus sp. (in: a-proteobacteria)]MDO5370389.1 chromosome partitioning protein ParB [Paracoccus sp. (in: a-proteobacteria)]
MTGKPFSVDLGRLRSREKDRSAAAVERADRAGEELGFIDRDPVKRRGRKPSPRTGQVHAKVLPHVAEAIAAEARRRGVQQGVVLEEAWALYQARQDDGAAG